MVRGRQFFESVTRVLELAHVSLRAKLVALCSLLVLILLAVLLFELPPAMEAQSLSWITSRSLGLGRLLASRLDDTVDLEDRAGVLGALNELRSNQWAEYAVLEDGRGEIVARWSKPGVAVREPPGEGEAVVLAGGLLHLRTPVRTRLGQRASLLLGFGLEELQARRRDAHVTVLRVAVLFLLAGLAVATVLGTVLSRPIERTIAVAQRIAAGEAVSVDQLPTERRDEFGRLARVFVKMLERLYEQQVQIGVINADLAERVRARTQELAATNQALAELARTQQQLVLADRRISVGRLAAGVAHEINNPLSYLSGNLEFLANELPLVRELVRRGGAEAAREAASVLDELASAVEDGRRGARRVVKIVQGLKTFARDDEDRREPVDLAVSMEAAIEMAMHEIKHRARLLRRIERAPPVIANEVRLCQVFLNLLINAWQAIPEGGLDRHEIRVSIGRDPGGDALVEVADTGVGIPPEVRGRVFDAFFTTKPLGLGSGLGLSISRNIVESFGGNISFESEVGRGTTFRVRLPAAPSVTAAPASPEGEVPDGRGAPAQGDRLRVLVIDDEPLVAVTVGRLLARKADLVSVATAREALALLGRGERFDRILCDVMMPEMSGPELHAQIAGLSAQAAAQLVFMTGGAFSESSSAFLEQWPNPVLQKPFDGEALWEALRGTDGASRGGAPRPSGAEPQGPGHEMVRGATRVQGDPSQPPSA